MEMLISIYRDQYKCGAFFENLREGSELTWLEALPEALKKVERENIDIKELVGEEIKEENFNNPPCDNKFANARCYAFVTKLTFLTIYFLFCHSS